MIRRCDACINWQPLGGDMGECRRRAPAPVLGAPPSPSIMLPVVWWPPVRAGDWCGEHHPLPVRQVGSEEADVICLIGSSRFKRVFEQVGRFLETSGNLVLCMTFFPHADGIQVSPKEREILRMVDRNRIDHAREVWVLDVNRYVGEDTRLEIAYAESRGKRLRYLSQEMPDLAQTGLTDDIYLAQLQRSTVEQEGED